MELKLDKQTFKALSNETRVEVLKALEIRRHTQSELAESLDVSVPTIKEHLDALVKAGLIERFEEGRKWKYYGLTSKGKGILQPEELKIWIVLSLFVFSAVGSAVSFANRLAPEPPVAEALMARSAEADVAMKAAAPVAQSFPWVWVFLGAAGICLLMLLLLLARRNRIKRHLGKILKKR